MSLSRTTQTRAENTARTVSFGGTSTTTTCTDEERSSHCKKLLAICHYIYGKKKKYFDTEKLPHRRSNCSTLRSLSRSHRVACTSLPHHSYISVLCLCILTNSLRFVTKPFSRNLQIARWRLPPSCFAPTAIPNCISRPMGSASCLFLNVSISFSHIVQPMFTILVPRRCAILTEIEISEWVRYARKLPVAQNVAVVVHYIVSLAKVAESKVPVCKRERYCKPLHSIAYFLEYARQLF